MMDDGWRTSTLQSTCLGVDKKPFLLWIEKLLPIELVFTIDYWRWINFFGALLINAVVVIAWTYENSINSLTVLIIQKVEGKNIFSSLKSLLTLSVLLFNIKLTFSFDWIRRDWVPFCVMLCCILTIVKITVFIWYILC